MMKIFFATSNNGKFNEVKEYFQGKGIEIDRIISDIEEPRGEIDKIAKYSVNKAYELTEGNPVFVEDTGLFISSLNGFPGEFSKWVAKKIGANGIIKLLEGEKEREAFFKTVIAFKFKDETHTFEGICHGKISYELRGKQDPFLPYDQIFIPEGYNLTFSEDPEIKSRVSHRIKALDKFYEFLSNTEL